MAEKKKTWIDWVLAAIEKDYAGMANDSPFETADPEIIMLPMPDGAALYTVICKPAGQGPFPTILMRSCYPDQEPILSRHAEEYCRRGFAFVYQLCRGTGLSEGKWEPNVNERRDGKETADWLASQSWAGPIGYWGSSYLALTGWAIADILPEKVKTLYLTHYGTDRYTSAYQCGLFRQDVLTAWAMGNAGFPVAADYRASLLYRPHVQVDEALWGGRLDWYRDWVTSTNRQDSYWNSGFWKELQEIPSRIKVPIYLGEGWYDHHLGSALRSWEALSAESKKNSILRIGAWNHGFRPCVEGSANENLENSDVKSAFAWFDAILRRGEQPEGRVLTYRINADNWQSVPAYPFEMKSERIFYLDAGGFNDQAYTLRDEPANEDATVKYSYDPVNPVPSHGAEAMLATMREVGSLVQPPCGFRKDVVSFVSDPLTEDINILGKIQIVLEVKSSADDTAFTAKLIEVKANGKAYNIRSGITTLAYRLNSDQKRMSYEPDTAVEANISLWDISWRVEAGSRLRLDISSSDFPQYAVHSNFAGVWSHQDRTRIAEQTIQTGIASPSRIILPIES